MIFAKESDFRYAEFKMPTGTLEVSSGQADTHSWGL